MPLNLLYPASLMICIFSTTFSSNAELIDQITGFDFLSPNAQNDIASAISVISSSGQAVASAHEVLNDMVASGVWETFKKVVDIGEIFSDFVGPVISPLSPVTDLLQREISIPWPGKIYPKKGLGKGKCSPDHFEMGFFEDKCWEKVSSYCNRRSSLFQLLCILCCADQN